MYEKPFHLEIITPSKVVFKDEATSLTAPGVLGSFQVLCDHAPFLSALEVGEMKVKDKNAKDTRYAVSGGFVEVKQNYVIVLADSAESVSEIDVDRAKASQARAEERLRAKQENFDFERAHVSLARALNRLRISQKG
jgi:F-type H+-transporting ATPase subunit epsilon